MTYMYADNVSTLTTASLLTQAQKSLESAVSAVYNWSKKWKLNPNTQKASYLSHPV